MNEISFTYIYALYLDDKITYIGKTLDPKGRFYYHVSTIPYQKMVIIDKYEDKEQIYIREYLNKGYELTNKEVSYRNYKKYEIGDVISKTDKSSKDKEVNIDSDTDKRNKTIFDSKINKIWGSIKECAVYYNIERNVLMYGIKKGDIKYKHLKLQ